MPATVDVVCHDGQLRANALECVHKMMLECKLSGYGQPGELYRVIASPKSQPGFKPFSYELFVGDTPLEASQHLINSIKFYRLYGCLLTFGFIQNTIKMDMQRETTKRLERFERLIPVNRRRPC